MEVQTIAVPDSPAFDALESVVELYFQVNGYITSSGKWFWVWDKKSKKQRGYQDIDVLAIGEDETLIVSVSSNLDDKAGFKRGGEFDQEKLLKLNAHFTRAKRYLKKVKPYGWLLKKPRKTRCIVAYHASAETIELEVVSRLHREGIEAMSVKPMLEELAEYSRKDNIKIQDPLMRLLKVVEWHGSIEI